MKKRKKKRKRKWVLTWEEIEKTLRQSAKGAEELDKTLRQIFRLPNRLIRLD